MRTYDPPFQYGEFVQTGWHFTCDRCGKVKPAAQGRMANKVAAICNKCDRWMTRAVRLAAKLGVEINPWEVPA